MKKHLDITVTGKVQHVFYRASTKAVADQLGVRGFVRNEADGSVFIEAEADAGTMSMFLDWCHEGPEDAEVAAVETHEGELKNYRNFEVVKINRTLGA
ncbi:acylphosphatase [Mucilaginibacter sp. JRF]|uniref:acylphosphatase n=1 Tax=Mucilaginibacter sp. JRF TaxID=2780088 RepID=UPI00187DF9FE|nr:acylphosphatase [Mucilaginibacter sp. JRF]MBE9585332.1 acylphosphatase [Mucilaginibacter sp. JRF]